ncbi:hypothetical protein [Azospirillum sp.]|uniref:hypothetical protein n=1 Tax=Azospirillum sp. TaxID=34012 RepID=UPI002D6CD7A3|nr:hypothetical protein [Azospirillum sp.]HYF89710.1 hypothetical protein [Azospirillum sp.]
MGLYLFNFVYNTLMQKANDGSPGNGLFLPKALAGMTDNNQQPYLPLQESLWTLNNIGGSAAISNDLATSWFNAFFLALRGLSMKTPSGAITQQMIDDAGAAVTYITGKQLRVVALPGAGVNLVATNIDIQGLANIKISGQPPLVTSNNQGYQAQIALNLNAYPDNGASWSQPLALSGSEQGTDTNNGTAFQGLGFVLTQTLCFVDKSGTVVAPPPSLGLTPSAANPNGFDCSATGIALLTLTNAQVLANGTVTVASPPALQFSLNSLDLAAVQGAVPTFTLQNLDYQSLTPVPFPQAISAAAFYPLWTGFFKQLIATNDAAQMLTNQINGALMSPDNMAQVANLLTSQISSALDTIFGSTQVADSTVDTDANDVDKYIFDRARGALNDPSGYVYVPTVILGSKSPQLDPLTATNLSIGGPFSTSVLGQSVQLSNISLANLVINGLSNVIAPPNSTIFGVNQQATATLLLGEVPAGTQVNVNDQKVTVPSPPVTASTPFSLDIQVNQNQPIPISGTLNISLVNNSGTLGVTTSLYSDGDTPQQLALTYTQVTLVAGSGDVTLAITLPPEDQQFQIFINAFLGQDALIQAIIGAINDYIGQNLGQISQAATQFAQNALNNLGK